MYSIRARELRNEKMGDMSRHLLVKDGLYRVEDLLDAACERFDSNVRVDCTREKGSVFRFTTKANAVKLLEMIGTPQAREVLELITS